MDTKIVSGHISSDSWLNRANLKTVLSYAFAAAYIGFWLYLAVFSSERMG